MSEITIDTGECLDCEYAIRDAYRYPIACTLEAGECDCNEPLDD